MTSEDVGILGSVETVKSELSIFENQSIQVTHLKGQWLKINPNNLYKGCEGGNIEFKIPKSVGWYLDFNDSYMILKTTILDKDAKALTGNEIVGFENNVISTMFRDVSMCSEDQTKLEGENQNYAYKAYLYTLLNASKNAKAFQLAVGGWMTDEAGEHDKTYKAEVRDVADKITTVGTGNKAFGVRMLWTDKSKVCEFGGAVYLDTWLQKQYMTDQQDFYLSFKLNSAKFMLHANVDTTEYKVNVVECALYMRQVMVSLSVIAGHMEGMKKHNFVVPYNGHKIFTQLITV